MINMTKLKAGKLYMNREDVLKGAGLPLDAHLDLIGYNEFDHTVEFKVVTSSDVEHECLVDYHEYMTTVTRRFPVDLEGKNKENKSTLKNKQWSLIEDSLGENVKYSLRGESPYNTDKIELALSLLKEVNRGEFKATRLKLVKDNSITVVEDFSYFCNSNYMSNGLLDAIQNKRTLTNLQKKELEPFIIETCVEIK